TLACYMIEGGGSTDFATVRRMAYARPDLLQHIVDVNTEAVAAYLGEQITAGVDAVMIFDTWGGLLATDQWRRFSLAPMRSVLERILTGTRGQTLEVELNHGGQNRRGVCLVHYSITPTPPPDSNDHDTVTNPPRGSPPCQCPLQSGSKPTPGEHAIFC